MNNAFPSKNPAADVSRRGDGTRASTRRQLIQWLRALKFRCFAAGRIARWMVPFLEVCEVWLDEGFRWVVTRSVARLGLAPAYTQALAGGDQGVARAIDSAYLHALAVAQNRAKEEFVPESEDAHDVTAPPVKLIAFYLPQFHPIAENDAWWGKGFTEWRNVSKAIPQFEGHYQPRLPGELGFYDLRVRDVQRRQVELARRHGLYAFCFHYYWFNGRRLLERPLDEYVADSTIDFPFCICWANESWTRRWDGMEHDVLIEQVHSEESDLAFIKDIEPLLRDPRYVRVNGRPVLIVYRVQLLRDAGRTAERWRAHCRAAGLPEPYLIAAQTFGFRDPRTVGFDAAVEFPPHNAEAENISRSVQLLNPSFEGRISRYAELAERMMEFNADRQFKAFKCVCPSWDNEARKPGKGYVLADSTPASYQRWLDSACDYATADPDRDTHLVFINAWNEWGEGAYLEPDLRYGYAYLEATRAVVERCRTVRPKLSVIVPNYNHARFLERRLTSIVNQTWRPDEIIFLDDASTDDSVAIARRILGDSAIAHTIVINPTNSGSVFRQWLNGIARAQGDLIWIAESDDAAGETFLEKLVPEFARTDVLLAYGNISYIDADGNHNRDLDAYYADLPGDRWRTSHSRTAHNLFATDFAVKNVIPNVSGAIFRRPTLSEAEIARLQSYRFAGDWYFYALVSRGGSISFQRDARSYFRKTQTSTSNSAFFSDRHVAEHSMIVQDLNELYGLSAATIHAHVAELERVLAYGGPERPRVDALMRVDTLPRSGPRPRRVCVASYGFAIGGGELAPIVLANALRDAGHHVTFLVLHDDAPVGASLRPRLRRDIPVLAWRRCGPDFVRDFGFDVINSHNVAVEYEFFLRGVKPQIPYVATLHGGYETVPEIITESFVTYLQGLVTTWMYTADKNRDVFSNTPLSRASFVRAFNAVPSPQHAPVTVDVRHRFHIPADAPLVVLASRAIPEKGWDIAVDATRRLRSLTGRDVHLLLIGTGHALEDIRRRAEGLPYIHFWGSTTDAIELIRQGDLAIFPSTYVGESFPFFLTECLTAGVPVIATDVGSIREMMTTDECGVAGGIVTVSPDRERIAADMAQAAARLLNDPEAWDSARANAASRGRVYSVERMLETYLSVFADRVGEPIATASEARVG